MLDGFETYKLMENRRGTIKPSEYFYSFGVLTRYWQNERNFSKAIVDALILSRLIGLNCFKSISVNPYLRQNNFIKLVNRTRKMINGNASVLL